MWDLVICMWDLVIYMWDLVIYMGDLVICIWDTPRRSVGLGESAGGFNVWTLGGL